MAFSLTKAYLAGRESNGISGITRLVCMLENKGEGFFAIAEAGESPDGLGTVGGGWSLVVFWKVLAMRGKVVWEGRSIEH